LEVGRLCTFLRQHRRIALDTSIFIYQLEEDIRYLALTDHIFSWLEQPGSSAVTSTITMTELLVQPYSALDEQRVDGLLLIYRSQITPQIRARHRLRTPGALQAATAVQAQATGLITNDSVFQRVAEFATLVLEQLV
jgi:predicted nucleic acid-binding protein